jgi:hypothetical protein
LGPLILATNPRFHRILERFADPDAISEQVVTNRRVKRLPASESPAHRVERAGLAGARPPLIDKLPLFRSTDSLLISRSTQHPLLPCKRCDVGCVPTGKTRKRIDEIRWPVGRLCNELAVGGVPAGDDFVTVEIHRFRYPPWR